MRELTPKQIAALRKREERKMEELHAKEGVGFTRAEILAMMKEVKEEENSKPSAEERDKAPSWWAVFLGLFQLPAMRLASAAVAITVALLVGLVVFVKPSGGYRQFALLTEKGGTEPAEVEKLNNLLHPIAPVMGATNFPKPALLLMMPDFEKLTIAINLPDGSVVPGRLSPLPPPDSETFLFQLSAKGAGRAGEPIEIEGDFSVQTISPVKSAAELRWKNVSSGRVLMRRPTKAELVLSSPSGARR